MSHPRRPRGSYMYWGRGKVWTGEKQFGRRHPFRLYPAPINCPCASEDDHDRDGGLDTRSQLALGRYIKHSRQCFIGYPNNSNFAKNTLLHVVFSTLVSVLDIPMKHFPSCLIYYLYLYHRLEQLRFQQNEEREQKLRQWEIWIIRITELEKKCQEKLGDLKSKGEPQDKTEVENQIILAKVSFKVMCTRIYMLLCMVFLPHTTHGAFTRCYIVSQVYFPYVAGISRRVTISQTCDHWWSWIWKAPSRGWHDQWRQQGKD